MYAATTAETRGDCVEASVTVPLMFAAAALLALTSRRRQTRKFIGRLFALDESHNQKEKSQ
ncbi:MAG: hypothetical protein DMF17_13185 [Verrucomicrobia bacterium]|nr:MAG: hypothetical protein DMF17_13185 [Verrucomicrobiota bacterium]